MECRRGCGACCIAISISSSIPGMANGKPAGVRCIHLDISNDCQLFGSKNRPPICGEFRATEWICGRTRMEAAQIITELELFTRG